MRISLIRNSLLKKRVIPVLLAVLLTVSMTAIAFTALTAGAAGETIPSGTTLYFNTKDNTAWGSTSTYAVFYNSAGVRVDKQQFASAGSNLYSVRTAAAASSVQLVQLNSTYNTWPPAAKPNGRRVIFKNSSNWTDPYIYAWKGGGGSGKENNSYPGVKMTNLSGDLYYYDMGSYEKLIFSNGTTSHKTGDLNSPAKDNDVYVRSSNGWVGNLYSKTSQTTDFSVRSVCSEANEIYVSSTGKLTMSKFPYSSRDFSSREKTVYLYNPNWTTAYVTFDFSDPYRFDPVEMTAMADKPKGFFQATVPSDAHFKFTPGTSTTGSSQETWFMEEGKDCYVISGSNEHWATVATATEDKADFYVNVGTVASEGNKNSSAYWVEATYFDYLDDRELEASHGWLHPKKGGTVFNSGDDQSKVWYPFINFNKWISDTYAGNWSNPLYFGNFFSDGDANNFGGTYSQRTGELNNFVPIVNNSNAPLPSMNHSVLGIAADSLDGNGNLMYPTTDGGAAQMPYFDRAALGNHAKTVSGYFPFNSKTGDNGVTNYSFDSKSTQDNVSFHYTDKKPTAVNFNSDYNNGTDYRVYDGTSDFMMNEGSQVGIFPFNKGVNNPGNGKLDYGFGIKLDMDFRVPEGGKNGNEDVKFEYSGDDDLWVYISPVDEVTGQPDYTKSKLALDLGGDHKMSEGNINFQTMKSHINLGVSAKQSTENVVYVDAHSVAEGNEDWYAYTWNNNGSRWVKGTGSSNNLAFRDLENYYIIVRLKKNATPCWENKWGQTDDLIRGNGQKYTISGYKGEGVFTGYYSDQAYEKNVSGKDFYFAKENFYNQKMDMTDAWELDDNGRLNPDKTYHLTVFYMERGLINSNNKMTFTMTPASNLVQVHKSVDVEGVNEAMQEDVRTKDTFTFDLSDTATEKSADLRDMPNQNSTEYNKVFKTNNDLTIRESFNSNLYYSTSWNVYDPDTGQAATPADGGNNAGSADAAQITEGGDRQAIVKLVNPTNALNMAKLRADYLNTPQTADLHILKEVYEEDGTTLSNEAATFNFTIGIDVGGGRNYKFYDLDYEAGGHSMRMNDGKFSFNSSDTVTIYGIPAGASYRIVEKGAAGFTCMNTQSTVTGVINLGDNTATFQNRITPSSATIEGRKAIQNAGTYMKYFGELQRYTGTMFRFTLKGLEPMAINSDTNTEDTSTDVEYTNAVSNGAFSFSKKYTKPGVYCYVLTEDHNDWNAPQPLWDDENSDGDVPWKDREHLSNDIWVCGRTYLVKVNVEDNNGTLLVNDPEYFCGEEKETYQYSDFADSNKIPVIEVDPDEQLDPMEQFLDNCPTFVNFVNAGSVTIKKQNQSEENMGGVCFALFKVDDDQTLSREDIVAEYTKFLSHEASLCVKDASTTEDGIAEFTGLEIYKADWQSQGEAPAYQRYAIAEIDPTDGYNLNGEVQYFTLPMWKTYEYESDSTEPTTDDGAEEEGFWTYHITYDYVNGRIVNPETSGFGMAALKTIGLILLGVSLLLLVGFLGYHTYKRRVPQRQGTHHKR